MSVIPADQLIVGTSYIGLTKGASPSTKKALLDFKIKYVGNSKNHKGWKVFKVGNSENEVLRNPAATNFYLASDPPRFTNENQKELNSLEEERIQKLTAKQKEQEERSRRLREEEKKKEEKRKENERMKRAAARYTEEKQADMRGQNNPSFNPQDHWMPPYRGGKRKTRKASKKSRKAKKTRKH